MHLLDRYALSCGVKISSPFILEHYYPIVLDKYIVFQTSGKGNSREYDYWPKVFSFIKEYAPEYKIIHVGLPSDHSVAGVDIDLKGKTNIKQLAFIIKNSSLYLGVDSLSTHLAGFYNKKIVALYSYCYAQNCKPVWGDKKNQKLIEVDWEKYGKPSFSLKENQKKINTIMPEIVAKAVLDKLEINNELDKIKTIYIGKSYHKPTIEIIPNNGPLPIIIKDKICNIRMDLFFNEKALLRLAHVCNLNIICDKEISLDLLSKIKSKITALTIVASDKISVEYLEAVRSLGFKIFLIADDNDDWGRLAEKFFDFCLDKEDRFDKKNIENLNQIDETCTFSSEKIIISDGKIFASKLSWKNDEPKLDKYSKVIDCSEFWEEIDHFYILKDERNNKK
ncbi:MAG: glycosyltransferase family 9 protein [Bacteroidetes bacterium]|nr:glycosyltransferase family 9 protein [Bacteroidota bacterium]